jgi:hypothetical protein
MRSQSLQAQAGGVVPRGLEFSFRVLACICTPETLALAFAEVLFIETSPPVIRPRSVTERVTERQQLKIAAGVD